MLPLSCPLLEVAQLLSSLCRAVSVGEILRFIVSLCWSVGSSHGPCIDSCWYEVSQIVSLIRLKIDLKIMLMCQFYINFEKTPAQVWLWQSCIWSSRRKVWSYIFLTIAAGLNTWDGGIVRMFWVAVKVQGKRSSCQGDDGCCFIHSLVEWNEQIETKSCARCHCLLCSQTFDPALKVGFGPTERRAITVVSQSQLCWNR